MNALSNITKNTKKKKKDKHLNKNITTKSVLINVTMMFTFIEILRRLTTNTCLQEHSSDCLPCHKKHKTK